MNIAEFHNRNYFLNILNYLTHSYTHTHAIWQNQTIMKWNMNKLEYSQKYGMIINCQS